MEFQSVGLEGLLNLNDHPYVGKERIIKRKKNFLFKQDTYGSTRIFYIVDEEVIGCFQILSNEFHNIGTNIFVKETHRRNGVSGLLIKEAYLIFPNMIFSVNTNFMSKGMIKKYSK